MSLLLNIDTALDTASICLANDGTVLQLAIQDTPKDHAGWLHTTIKIMLEKSGNTINQIEAIAVSIGPGSYTGLRVGLASAKGFCYALNIPLIAVNTLEMMAQAVKDEAEDLICPMIDARRNEVFTAVYTKFLAEEIPPRALILDETSFHSLLSAHKILFCGNGSQKWRSITRSANAYFSESKSTASDLAQLSYNCFLNKEFADLTYTEPLYLKEFYLPTQKK